MNVDMTPLLQTQRVASLTKNARDITEAQEYTDKLTADRSTLVAQARKDGVTWRQIEAATGSTRQTLTKGLNQ